MKLTSFHILIRRTAAECIGTAMLLTTVVGSGIMAEKLAGGNVAIALLANAVATGAALIALILIFADVSGAHFNPAVTLACASRGDTPWADVPAYLIAQVLGAFAGVAAAHVMFGLPVVQTSVHVRSGLAQGFSEIVATFGLLITIFGCSRRRPEFISFAVGLYITAAYWFTASTSFANPAVTLARCMTNTFAGIRPVDAPQFVLAEVIRAALAVCLFRWLVQDDAKEMEGARESEASRDVVLQRSR